MKISWEWLQVTAPVTVQSCCIPTFTTRSIKCSNYLLVEKCQNGGKKILPLFKKQALRSKFLVTAKGWFWQTFLEIGCQPLFCESGCQPVHCTFALLYYAVKFVINFWCQPLHCTFLLVYILNYVIWNENEWRIIDILFAIDISETQYRTEWLFY